MSTPTADPRDIPRHPVRVAAQKTGLSSHVLRAWERRYGVVAPTRTEGGQRLYSDADIERLTLLSTLASRGGAIGQLADLPTAELTRLSREDMVAAPTPEVQDTARWRELAFHAIEAMDGSRLRRELSRGVMALGVTAFLEEVADPLLREWGTLARGAPSASRRSTSVRWWCERCSAVRESAETSDSAPRLVVATLVNQLHEGGALLAAAAAAAEGWRVTYLGTNLPSADIAATAVRTGARAVAVSVIFPADDPAVPGYFATLRQGLPAHVALLVGGSATASYSDAIDAAEGEIVSDLPGLRSLLRELARP
ncbi:MAG: MerR family transcriptional regulator [Gemmatimonadales bacterium]|nr:MerR family transcriptional regulator [Gemmatimonadales bacterium]